MKWFAILFAGMALGQTPEQSKTFTFAHSPTAQTVQEVVNTMRGIGEIARVAADSTSRTISVTGTADQLAFAQWAFTELDGPAAAAQALTTKGTSYAGEACKILYPSHLTGPRSMQELVNGIRSIADVQRTLPVNAVGAIVMRGKPEQVALAEWVARQLDDASGGVRQTVYGQFAVRYYSPAQIQTVQDFQEAVQSLRVIADLQRVVVLTEPRAIALIGTPEQVALTDWMMKELDQAAPAVAEAHETSFLDSTVRAAFLAKNTNLAGAVKKVKDVTGMARVTAAQRPRAIVLRGTPGQIALAEGLLR